MKYFDPVKIKLPTYLRRVSKSVIGKHMALSLELTHVALQLTAIIQDYDWINWHKVEFS